MIKNSFYFIRIKIIFFLHFVCESNIYDIYLHSFKGRLAQLVQSIPISSEVVGTRRLKKNIGAISSAGSEHSDFIGSGRD